MAAFTHLTIYSEGGVQYVTLNRPEVRNAFDETTIAELAAWATSFSRDGSTRAVVLRGAGKVFCAGADVAWMSKMAKYSREENLRDASAAAAMFAAIDALPVPVIARVHGGAIGGGAGLAAVADIAVAEATATFAFSEVKLGLIPAVISPYVLAKIGRSAARDLFLSGRKFTADEALRIGLVHAVVPSASLDVRVGEYLKEIRDAGADAVAAAKAFIREVAASSPDQVRYLTAEAIADRRAAPEAQQRLAEFLGKKK